VKSLLFVEYSFNKITFFIEMQWLAHSKLSPRSSLPASSGEIPPIFPQLRPTFRGGPHRQTG
jgi:hypothetical protein